MVPIVIVSDLLAYNSYSKSVESIVFKFIINSKIVLSVYLKTITKLKVTCLAKDYLNIPN